MLKIHLFYIDDKLYAYTNDGKAAKKFAQQRSKKIKYKIKKMSSIKFSLLTLKDPGGRLIINPLDSQSGLRAEIVTSITEDEMLTAYVNELIDERDRYIQYLDHLPLKDKYKNLLVEGLSCASKPFSNSLNLDLLSMFVDMFQSTFVGK